MCEEAWDWRSLWSGLTRTWVGATLDTVTRLLWLCEDLLSLCLMSLMRPLYSLYSSPVSGLASSPSL